MNPVVWPELELDLMQDLAARVRLVSAEQLNSAGVSVRAIRKLVRQGALVRRDIVAASVDSVEILDEYTPGSSRNWALTAAELACRWSKATVRPMTVFHASRRSISVLGGCMSQAGIGSFDMLTHDLGVTAVFLTLLRNSEFQRKQWIPEERVPDQYGVAKPDAILIREADGCVLLEFAGLYRAERLERLGHLANMLRLPLQIWTVKP